MQTAKLFKNSFSAISQVVVVGVVYFLLYAYLLHTIGIELLGVWSLIIATTSMALIANFGISTSIVKFVSTYASREDYDGLRKLIFTSSLFIVVAYVVIAALLLFIGPLILPHFIEPAYLGISLQILPFSLVSLIINALGGVMSGCLDGLQKNYVRSYIVSGSSVVLLATSMWLAPTYGLKGLIFSQILQGLLVLVFSMISISRNVKGAFSFGWNWSHLIFKEVIAYGLKMQSLSLMQMSFEPVTKAFLSKFGGLAMVGFYEMANRLVSQLRSLIVSGNQVVIPLVAEAKEKNEGFIKELYIRSFSIILFLNIILITGIILAVPVISMLWIGKWQPFFAYSAILSALAVFVNISSNPAYFSYMGEGRLNWLIYSYVGVTSVNCVLGYFLGFSFGGYGVVAAWNLAFLTGSLIVLLSYHKENTIRIPSVVSKGNALLIAASACLCFCGYKFEMSLLFGSFNYMWTILTVVSMAFFGAMVLSNPDFKLIIAQLIKYLPSKSR